MVVMMIFLAGIFVIMVILFWVLMLVIMVSSSKNLLTKSGYKEALKNMDFNQIYSLGKLSLAIAAMLMFLKLGMTLSAVVNSFSG